MRPDSISFKPELNTSHSLPWRAPDAEDWNARGTCLWVEVMTVEPPLIWLINALTPIPWADTFEKFFVKSFGKSLKIDEQLAFSPLYHPWPLDPVLLPRIIFLNKLPVCKPSPASAFEIPRVSPPTDYSTFQRLAHIITNSWCNYLLHIPVALQLEQVKDSLLFSSETGLLDAFPSSWVSTPFTFLSVWNEATLPPWVWLIDWSVGIWPRRNQSFVRAESIMFSP